MTTSWIEIYKSEYKPLLNINSSGTKRGLAKDIYNRAEGYQLIFELMLANKANNFEVIETGTVRNPMNWKDGNSGFLFSEFVKRHQGRVRSVDIDPEAVERARTFVDGRYYSVDCSDSVTWLESQTDLDQVDLFYLDSWDVKWKDDRASAEHHLKEFLAIEPHIKSGSIVAIDDNARFADTNARTGKGRRIVEYLESKNIAPVYDEYQIIYKF